MTKQEVISFTKKIGAYYKTFSLNEKEQIDEWIKVLTPYRKEDIEKRFDEHIRGEDALRPPMLHYLVRNLMTEEEANKSSQPGEYIVRCNLCGKEMSLSTYDKVHYEKCLLIKSLLNVLEQKGKPTTYEELDKYDVKTLDQVWLKYVPITKTFNW